MPLVVAAGGWKGVLLYFRAVPLRVLDLMPMVSRTSLVQASMTLLPALSALGGGSSSKIIPRISRAWAPVPSSPEPLVFPGVMRSEVLLIGGRAGVGKSSVGNEVHVQLSAARVWHAFIEGDNLDR